ncbi:WhiB family transcriptional regulator [Streptomyces sp. NPDC059740]|uniref:WhiB family transcriptional regulator n=1 Tax=Streptomyces sp. NPDC059740 TaxID=3346926 RepID=UPI003655FA00
MTTDQPLRAPACGPATADLFHDEARYDAAKRICRTCPLREDCLEEALDRREPAGVFGGRDQWERRALLRQRGLQLDTITPRWRAILESPEASAKLRKLRSRGWSTARIAQVLRTITPVIERALAELDAATDLVEAA